MTWATQKHGTPAPYERWYPCIALRTRGRIGHMWVFKSYRAAFKIPNVDYPRNPYRFRQGGHPGMIVTHWYYPYNMRTQEQQAWRQGMINAVSYWQGFDSGTKSYYNEFARNRPISGYTRYIQLYLKGYIPAPPALSYMLQENGDFVLQENGNKIII